MTGLCLCQWVCTDGFRSVSHTFFSFFGCCFLAISSGSCSLLFCCYDSLSAEAVTHFENPLSFLRSLILLSLSPSPPPSLSFFGILIHLELRLLLYDASLFVVVCLLATIRLCPFSLLALCVCLSITYANTPIYMCELTWLRTQ